MKNKIIIRFVTGSPENFTWDKFYDTVVDDFVVYPMLEINGEIYYFFKAVSVIGHPEADKMIMVSKNFGRDQPDPVVA